MTEGWECKWAGGGSWIWERRRDSELHEDVPGEGTSAASKPATQFQDHDAQTRTHESWSPGSPYCGNSSEVSQTNQLWVFFLRGANKFQGQRSHAVPYLIDYVIQQLKNCHGRSAVHSISYRFYKKKKENTSQKQKVICQYEARGGHGP